MSSLRLLSLSCAVLCAAALASSAFAQPLSCSSLAPTSVPFGSHPEIPLAAAPVMHSVFDGADPITAIRIAPPVMLSPADAYQCGVDYSASRVGASIVINFNRNGPYVIDLDRQSGARDISVALVATESAADCSVGRASEFSCPAPPKAYAGSDLQAGRDRFGNPTVTCTVNNVADLVNQVCNNPAIPIDLFLVDHGCSGSINIGGNSNLSCDPADAARLATFRNLLGKVKSINFLSCSTGGGAAGQAFLCKISQQLVVPVTAYTGTVSNWTDKGGVKRWSVAGQPTTIDKSTVVKVPAESMPGISLVGLLLLLGAWRLLRAGH